MNTNPKNQPTVHHLNIADMRRIMAEVYYTAVPLRCNEDECFVDGSELSAHSAAAPDESSAPRHSPTQKAR